LSLDATLVQDDVPLEVVKKLFLGSIYSAFNLDGLMNCGITHILNASRVQIAFANQFTYLSVDIKDKEESNILACIPTTNIFIQGGVDRGAILVHCFGGKSRSPAFIAAFLMSTHGWTFDDACKLIKSVRPTMEINLGFECQLRAFYAAKFDVYLAQQLLLRTRIRDLHFARSNNNADHKYGSNFRKSIDSSKTDSVQHPYSNSVGSNYSKQSYSGLKRTLSDSKETCGRAQSVITGYELKCDNISYDNMEVDAVLDLDDSVSYNTPIGKPQGVTIQCRERDALEESVDSGITTSSAMSLDQNYSEFFKPDTPTKRNITNETSRMKSHQEDDYINSKLDSSGSLKPKCDFQMIDQNGFAVRRSINNDSSHPKKIKAAARSGSLVPSTLTSDVMAKFPSCRLSRPGCQSVRIIPPLRGLQRDFKCLWCDMRLFQLANVLQIDLNIADMMNKFQEDLRLNKFNERNQQHNVNSSNTQNYSPTGNSKLGGADLKLSYSSINVGSPDNNSSRYPNLRLQGLLPPIASSKSTSLPNKNQRSFTISNGAEMDVEDSFSHRYKEEDFSSSISTNLKTTRASGSRNKSFNFDITEGSTMSEHSINKQMTPSSHPHTPRDNVIPSPRLLPNLCENTSKNSQFFSKPFQKSLNDERFTEIANSNGNNTLNSYRFGPPYNNMPNGYDESPRVILPPLRNMESNSLSNLNTVWSRPKSAEQRRWLARMNLLNEGDTRVLTIAEADIIASQHAYKSEKYLYIEYLEWMGKDVFSQDIDHGDICCPGCRNTVGKWVWTPSNRLLQDGRLEAPLFFIPKQVLYQTDISLDPTPNGTPRDTQDHSF